MPEFVQLLNVKSMIRYLPPKGTAGFARLFVNEFNLLPLPPANNIATHLPLPMLASPLI